MSDLISQLEKTYCPPLDSALFFAIISDYDLTEGDSLSEVRSTLDALKESAEAEESTAFDPSGSSRQNESASARASPDRAQSWHGDAQLGTEETDLTSVSQSLESMGIDGASASELEGDGYDLSLDDLSSADKEALLCEMFPELKLFDISFALRKCKNNFGKTVEELLNQVFLSEEQITSPHLFPRGIDAFMDHDDTRQTRKTKRKKRKKAPLSRRSSSTPAPLSENVTSSPTLSKWDLAKQDVDFITQRTYLTPQTVTSMYHKSGASLRSTLLALCASDSLTNPYIESSDPIIQAHACELAQDFPHLPTKTLTALIHLTHPSTASAHELALAITSHTSSFSSTNPPTNLLPSYAPPSLTSSSPPLPPKNILPVTLSHPTASHLATVHTTSSAKALATASSAYRASRSQPLMAHASSYYASLARTRLTTAHHYRSLAADALVSSHSSPSQIDLHGVSVADGVRIAREKVQAWWEGGQAEWAREGKVRGEGGFRIVTGVGRHSEGGRGRLGPAVGGMLVKDGWRVEVGEGILVVRGRARK